MIRADDPIILAPLLDLLLHKRESINPTSLAQRLGLTDQALMTELDRLRQAGCELAIHPQYGVRLSSSGLGAWTDYLQWVLAHERTQDARKIEVYNRTRSTQDVARRLMQSHGQHSDGSIVVADEQTAGRGRLGRRWVAPPGTAVMFSQVRLGDRRVPTVKHPQTQMTVDHLTWVVAVAVALALEEVVTGMTVTIKWPNDLLIEGNKIAGILIETSPLGPPTFGVGAVIGVGINASLQREQLPREPSRWHDRVTSLSMVGCPMDRLLVLAQVLRQLDHAMASPEQDRLLDQWRRRCPMLGRHVRLQNNGKIIQGRVEDLDPMAGLILRTEWGGIVHLPAATTTLLAMT